MIVVVTSIAASAANAAISTGRGRRRTASGDRNTTRGIVANSVTVASCEYIAKTAHARHAHDEADGRSRRAALNAKCSADRYQTAANAVVTAHTQMTASTYDGITLHVMAVARA